MELSNLTNRFLDQSKDAIWMVNLDFQLIYANKAYLLLIEEVAGVNKKIIESSLLEVLGKEDMERWKAYYVKAFKGEYFEIEQHHYNSKINQIQFRQTIFEPVIGEDKKIVTVACRSKDITRLIKQKSEASLLIDASLDVFCTFNPRGEFVYVSASALQQWGFTPEELLGKPFMDFVLEEDIVKTKEITDTIRTGKNIKTFFNRYLKKDGTIAYNLWSATWDDNSKLIYASARDGKEKIEQEEKLLRSEQRFKALLQGGNDLYSIIDPEGRYIYMSPSSTAIIGIPPEAFIGRDAFEFIHPDDLDKTKFSLKKVATEDKVIMELYRAKNQNNEWRWVETVLTNMLDNPAVNGIVINSRDLTKEVEEKYQLKLLESVITNTQDAVLITEAEPLDVPGPKIVYVNDAFTKMTGYDAEDVIGKTPRIFQGPNSDKIELEKLGRAIRKWESYEITTINYKKSGEEFWINFVVTPIANKIGHYTHLIAIGRDVTEQKNRELEKELIGKINSIFNQSIDTGLAVCLTGVCQLITEFGDFAFSEIWLPAIDEKRINRVGEYANSNAGMAFYNATKFLNSFDLGEGLFGSVWRKRTIQIWDTTESKWLSKRKVAANKAGIQCMMGVPLKDKEKVIGLLLIGTEKKRSFLAKYSEIFNRIEGNISAELSRKNVEIELAQIFDFSPDMICVADFQGYIKRMNPAGIEILGYSLDEIRSKPILSFMHEEDRLITKKKQGQLYQGKKLQSFENRYITKKGNTVWLSWTATSIPEYRTVYAVAKDITQEKNLRELNRQVGKLAKIGSWEVDLVNHSIFWTEEVHLLHATDPDSYIPNLEGSINFYRDDFRKMVASKVQNCISTGKPYEFEAIIVAANKKEVWVRSNGKGEFVDGVCVRIYGSIQDISAVKETENRLLSLSENLPGVVYQYLINPAGTNEFRYVSKGADKLWGFTANEVMNDMGLVWNQIEKGGNIKNVESSILKSIETKSKWTSRYNYVLPTGELRIHLGFGTPNFLADGTVLFNAIALDITQESKNEELLAQITNIARIGSWELDLINKEGGNMYWSPMLFEILELEENFLPNLNVGIDFHVGESRDRIQKALHLLITEGIEFDEEILVLTAKGNKRWNRAIGKCEKVNNKVTRIYGSYQDIHNRKESELELLKAKEKAEESDAKFKSYTEQSPIAIYTTDIKGNYIYANETWLEIAGMQLEEALGKGWLNAVHPDDLNYVRTNWYKSVKSSGKWSYEYRFKDKEQNSTWINGTAKELFNENNKLIGYLGSNVDITERKIAEQEKNNLQVTIENSLNEIYIFDAKTLLFTYVNKGAYRNLGYSEEEMKTFTPIDIKPDYTPKLFDDLVAPLIHKEKEKILFFTNHLRKDGSKYPVEVHLQLFDEGENKRFLAIILDITERKKAEEENRFKANLLSMVGQAAIATNLDGVVKYWNKAAENMYGWKAEEAIGKNILQLTPTESNINDAKRIMEALKKGEMWSGEFNVHKKDGTTFPALITNSPIYDEDNLLSGLIGISTDITKEVENRKLLSRYTHELERSNEELEQFAFIASHDLQEPLRMITSFMDQLKRKYGNQLDEKAHQYIHFATDGAKRMKEIILDLLEYSRAKKATEGKEKVDLNEVVSEFKLLRKKLISEKSAKITSSLLPILYTYKAVIVQILHCLLDNALKYSKADTPPVIEIKAVENEKEWKLSIKDNGIGIDSKFYDKIFVIFQRLHNRDEYDGTGIGLSIAKRHVELLDGQLWLKSAPGEGTVFYFTISKNSNHK